METISTSTNTPAPACKRCKEGPATVKMRAETVCQTCFTHFIAGKAIKRMEVLNRETRPSSFEIRTMLLGLSFGPSSSAMVHVLYQNYQRHEPKKRRGGVTEYAVVHVDTSLSPGSSSAAEALIERYRARFPAFHMSVVPLKDILRLQNIDWTGLPPLNPDLTWEPEKQLQDMFARLPSTTSKADILRLFVRHLLLAETVGRKCSALLLGHTTTALAETTLSEAAKGRGFAVPWLVADGSVPVPTATSSSQTVAVEGIDSTQVDPTMTTRTTSLPIYYPMRDVFRKEVIIYNKSVSPPITDLVPDGPSSKGSSSGAAVVSHKSISIEEVMGRFFKDVEENYPSIVANVIRTSAKLTKPGLKGDDRVKEVCGLCGLGLDETGDERWRGEMGGHEREVVKPVSARPLCYGCDRSVKG